MEIIRDVRGEEGTLLSERGFRRGELYYVKLDKPNQDVIPAFQADRNGVFWGKRHRHESWATARRFEIVRTESSMCHWIGVDYLLPEETPGFQGWSFQSRGTSITRHMIQELTGDDFAPRIVGPAIYEPVPDDFVGPVLPPYTIEGTDIHLVATGRRIPQGYELDVPARSVTLTANCLLDLRDVALADPYIKRINKFKFLGAAPGHVKCEEIVVDQIPQPGIRATRIGLPSGKVVASVSLSFLWSAERLDITPDNFHTFEADDGTLGFVLFDGNRITEPGFRVGEVADINGLFDIFKPMI